MRCDAHAILNFSNFSFCSSSTECCVVAVVSVEVVADVDGESDVVVPPAAGASSIFSSPSDRDVGKPVSSGPAEASKLTLLRLRIDIEEVVGEGDIKLSGPVGGWKRERRGCGCVGALGSTSSSLPCTAMACSPSMLTSVVAEAGRGTPGRLRLFQGLGPGLVMLSVNPAKGSPPPSVLTLNEAGGEAPKSHDCPALSEAMDIALLLFSCLSARGGRLARIVLAR